MHMHTKRSWWSAALVCGALLVGGGSLAGGCNRPDAKTDGASSRAEGGQVVAVVDLDKVARDLGWITKMQANLETYQGQLKNDVLKYAGSYEKQIQGAVRALFPKDAKDNDKLTLTPDQTQQLSQYVAAGRQQVSQLASKADQMFGNYRLNWIKQYRDALAPVVRQVAQDKKVTVVLLSPSDNVLFAEPSIDLTNAVVDAARSKKPDLTEVPMSPLEGPATINYNPTGGPATQPSTTGPAPKPDANKPDAVKPDAK
jgi:Skp family chaperone for outer membrane proteins